MIDCRQLATNVEQVQTLTLAGRVKEVIGLVITGQGPLAAVGGVCAIEGASPSTPIMAEVVGFRHQGVLLMPYGEVRGVEPGSRITLTQNQALVPVGEAFLGRVIDGLGRPIDGLGPIRTGTRYPLYVSPLNPVTRELINEPVDVGVRAVNGLLTLGKGQRIGIFSGSGVGKSTLMGMVARYTKSDVSVIGLVGERGREVKEFIEKDLGPEGLARSVVVAATSDTPALIRLRAAYLSTAIAEYFRDQGRDVILMVDSVTRFAMAAREVGLAIGEPPTARGYTPSVFSQLPRILERAGTHAGPGSITGIYTVLVEGDDLTEPIADAVRSIADGHIVLSRELADRGHYPAIDVLGSISRVMPSITDPEHRKYQQQLIRVVAAYRQAEDLININAYVRGSNPEVDFALDKIDRVNQFLRQDVDQGVSLADSVQNLAALFAN
ncbi:MAG: FliI/YscN family ATPase [Desulfobacca sp.]|nr:FliI/YscN family ATPase [Desulfobacca sp.]